MLRVSEILKDWTGGATDEIRLDFQDRHRRRIVLTSARGTEFLLDLGEVPDLREGDALRLASGEVVMVRAAPEALMEIVCADPLHLARIAWHLGNRHLPTEIAETRLRIHADHVIAGMVKGLGGEVRSLNAPFNPEGGAYASVATGHVSTHGHDHGPHRHEGEEHDHGYGRHRHG